MSIVLVDKNIVWQWLASDNDRLDVHVEDLQTLLHKTHFSDSLVVQSWAAQKNNSAPVYSVAGVGEHQDRQPSVRIVAAYPER